MNQKASWQPNEGRSANTRASPTYTPLISIVVPVYTTERLHQILNLLDSVESQTYSNIETIIVTEDSSDLKPKIMEYLKDKKSRNVRVLVNHGKIGACSARNLGINEAKGDIIALVDDDVVLFADWAEEMVNAYQSESVIGVTGPVFPLWDDDAIKWFPVELDWIFGCARWIGGNRVLVRNVNGPNASFRREAFALAGTYHVDLGPMRGMDVTEWESIGEEAELSLRVARKTGKNIVYDPGVGVYHRVTRNKLAWKYIIQRSYQVGRTRRALKKIYGTEEKDILATEAHLARRIFLKLVPEALREFLRRPFATCRVVLVCIVAIVFVGLGYSAPFFEGNWFGRPQR